MMRFKDCRFILSARHSKAQRFHDAILWGRFQWSWGPLLHLEPLIKLSQPGQGPFSFKFSAGVTCPPGDPIKSRTRICSVNRRANRDVSAAT
jgi:hypothetical protein